MTINNGDPTNSVLVVGRKLVPELLEAIHSLPECTRTETIEEAIQLELDPSVIVVCQNRPGEISENQISQLQAKYPLASWIALLGGWCEGEVRTGKPWHGFYRIYWHQFRERVGEVNSVDELRVLLDLPKTAEVDDETLLRADSDRSKASFPDQSSRSRLLIRASDKETYQSLAEALERMGYESVWVRGPVHANSRARGNGVDQESVAPLYFEKMTLAEGSQGVIALSEPMLAGTYQALLWCADLSREDESQLLANAAKMCGALPIILVAGFPRWSTIQTALSCGATRVLSKPFMLEDLEFALATKLRASESNHSTAMK